MKAGCKLHSICELDLRKADTHHYVMKSARDDYKAKLRMWIANPASIPLPTPVNLPYFGSKRFSSYAELNEWKREYRQEIARSGGVKWKS